MCGYFLELHEICGSLETLIPYQDLSFVAGTHRCLRLPISETLIVSDCHIGKATHFRRNNLPVPQAAAYADLVELQELLNRWQPKICIFLGDLFHSTHNKEWPLFAELLAKYPNCRFVLVQGNHDILDPESYVKAGLEVVPTLELLPGIVLSHEPIDGVPFNICGHIHPGISIQGKARQHLRLPCYFKTETRLYMPAFGALTGHIDIGKFEKTGKAWCFTESEIFGPIVL